MKCISGFSQRISLGILTYYILFIVHLSILTHQLIYEKYWTHIPCLLAHPNVDDAALVSKCIWIVLVGVPDIFISSFMIDIVRH